MRECESPSNRAKALAMVVFPTHGKSSISTWPWVRRAISKISATSVFQNTNGRNALWNSLNARSESDTVRKAEVFWKRYGILHEKQNRRTKTRASCGFDEIEQSGMIKRLRESARSTVEPL